MNIPTDKLLHVAAGYFIATVLPVLPIYGLALATIAGIAKEAYDSRGHGTVEVQDARMTVAGGFMGFLVLLLK